MLAKARIRHLVEKRVRIEIPTWKKSTKLFMRVEGRLRANRNISHVEFNPVTGSLLIKFEGPISGVGDYARSEGLFDLDLSSNTNDWMLQVLSRVSTLDSKIKGFTGGRFNLASATGVAFLSLSGLQVYRKQLLPAASALALYAIQFLEVPQSKNKTELMQAHCGEVKSEVSI